MAIEREGDVAEAMQVARLRVASCVLGATVACHPDATRNPQLSLGFLVHVRAYVYVPYIYKIKIKKKNIPIGLRLRGRTETEKYSKIQRRVAGCRLRSAIGGLLHFFMQLLTGHYFPNTKAIPSERYPIELSQSS